MYIHQFYDEGLAHASYAIHIDDSVVIIDPARDPQPYLDFADERKANITAIIETHPHADFASSHSELHLRTAAPVYASKLTKASYPHQPFDEGQALDLGGFVLRPLNTPGHSPDSISVVLEERGGKQHAVFTGDTLFVGDVGRPDLREGDGSDESKREKLARDMFHSLHDKLAQLQEEVTVYPAHGPGSLCGKGAGDERTSTIEREINANPAFEPDNADDFVEWLLADQPFVPQYFPYDVQLNRRGVPDLKQALDEVPRLAKNFRPEEDAVVVDTRDEAAFKQGFTPGALNIQNGAKFETWLGSLVAPGTPYYLVAATEAELDTVLRKAAKIGYEPFVQGAFVQDGGPRSLEPIDLNVFRHGPQAYTIVDVRNANEVEESGKKFPHALSIPLPELPDRTDEIPTDRPVVVHCAGGYRSAAAASIVDAALHGEAKVLDLSDAVKEF